MLDWDHLPTIFAQKTEQNERIISLLSAVLYRRINPSFTPAIRRHPLSLWTIPTTTINTRTTSPGDIPVAILIQDSECTGGIQTISKALKKAIGESRFVVAELQGDQTPAERTSVLSKFMQHTNVFIISISPTTLRVSCGTVQHHCPPSLVLVSKDESTTHRPEIWYHIGDPDTIVVSLLESLDAYGDDGAKTLWVVRCVLKFMNAAQQIQTTSGTARNIVSRL